VIPTETSPPSTSGRVPSWIRRLWRVWGFLAFIVVVLIASRSVMRPFVLGVLVAYVLAPVVNALARVGKRGRPRMPRWVAVILVYLGLVGVIALALTAFMPRLSADAARLFREAPRFLAKVRTQYVPAADRWLEANFPQEEGPLDEPEPRPERKLRVTQRSSSQYEISLEGLELEIEPAGRGRYVIGPRSDSDEKRPRLADLLGRAAASTETEMKGVLSVGRRFLTSVVRSFAWFVLTFMVAAYLLVDLDRVMRFIRSLVPPEHRAAADEILQDVDRGLSGVIRGQLLICLLNGLLTTVGLVLLKVKYSLLLGAVAGVMSFIPVFGSILSSVPIVVVALASGPDGISISTGVGVLAWIVGIHFLEANFFNPKIIGTAAKIHPVIVVFALLVGEESGGLVGALLAVPIASIVQAVFIFLRRRQEAQQAPTPSLPSEERAAAAAEEVG
jgi:predicted PurR-regulated permease PerM